MTEPNDFQKSISILMARCELEIVEIIYKISGETKAADELHRRYTNSIRAIESFNVRRDEMVKNILELQKLRDKDPDNNKISGTVG